MRAEVHVTKPGKAGIVIQALLFALFLAFLAVVLFIASLTAFAYMHLQGNISQADISDLLGEDSEGPSDPEEGHDYNILVMGSDSRAGESNIDGGLEDLGENSMRSDTTMLVHISADRSHIEVVSIPRDTLVTIPSCTVRKSKNSKATFRTEQSRNTQFNWAFSQGGQTGDVPSAAACTIKTTERLTGVTINGYIVVNFAAFQNIINALGGVPMYFEEELTDSMAGLHVLEGCRLLDGKQGLALARARYEVGKDGSDTARIGRQQELVGAIIREVFSMNLLTDSTKLYKVLDAGTQSLATSKGLGDLTTLVGLLYSLRSIDMNNVHFITMPFKPAPQDPNRVVPTKDAKLLWKAIKRDKPAWMTEDGSIVVPDLQKASPSPSGSESDNPQTSPSPTPTVSSTPKQTNAPVCTKKNALKPNYDK